MTPNVVIAIPTLDTLPSTTVENLFSVYERGVDAGYMTCPPLFQGGPYIDLARNFLLERIKGISDPTPTHVLWVDSDMVLPQNTIAYLVEQELPIVGGLYYMRQPPHRAVAFYKNPNNMCSIDAMHLIEPMTRYEVDAIGHGCLMVDLQVYWDHEEPHYHHDSNTDDSFFFCFWARDAGHKVILDTTVDCGHMSLQPVTGLTYKHFGKAPNVPAEFLEHPVPTILPEVRLWDPEPTIDLDPNSFPAFLFNGEQVPYDSTFFTENLRVGLTAANIVLPPLLDQLDIHSVIDVGCGSGAWTSVAKGHGCKVMGVDGHAPQNPLLDDGEFTSADLTQGWDCSGYDLAICLEVAEHLAPGAASLLVKGLCEAKWVLWSAAIPGQGGTNHINEQWQTYWESIFYAHGMIGSADLCEKYWDDNAIAPFYRHGMIVYAHPGDLVSAGFGRTIENRRHELSPGDDPPLAS